MSGNFLRKARDFSIVIFFIFSFAGFVFAAPPGSQYGPAETLDPSCAPGDANCSVLIIPDQTGESGKYLTTDGSSVSWGTVSSSSTLEQVLTTGAKSDNNMLLGATGGADPLYNIEITGNYNGAAGMFINNDHTSGATFIGFSEEGQGSATFNAYIQRTNSLNGTRPRYLDIFTADAGPVRIGTNNAVRLTIGTTGQLTAANYGSGSITGTATYSLAVDSSGNIIEEAVAGSSLDALSDCITDYTTGYNMFCGDGSGASIAAGGSGNLGIGQNALGSVTTGDHSVAVGYRALAAGTGSYNVAVGSEALDINTTGARNVAIGRDALGSNLSGGNNVAIGFEALFSNTASNNIGIGYDALFYNSSGTRNTAVGMQALNANTTSSDNTAFGYNALFVNTGANNLAVGSRALDANTTGTPNLAIGRDSLGANQTGGNNLAIGDRTLLLNTASNNLAIGPSALDANTSGTPNLAIGRDALGANQTGNNSLAIGDQALVAATGGSNIGIGHSAGSSITTGSGNIIIGNSLQPSAASATNELNLAGVIFSDNITTGHVSVGPSDAFEVSATGTITMNALTVAGSSQDALCIVNGGTELQRNNGAQTCTVSSARFKHDIVPIGGSVIGKLEQLVPSSFIYNGQEGTRYGLIAEEVALVEPNLIFYESDGITPRGVRYEDLTALSLKGIQELDFKIESIENFENENKFTSNLRVWLSNFSNKISRIFTGEICLTAGDGSVECINKEELTQLKQLLHQGGGVAPVEQAPSPVIKEPEEFVEENLDNIEEEYMEEVVDEPRSTTGEESATLDKQTENETQEEVEVQQETADPENQEPNKNLDEV